MNPIQTFQETVRNILLVSHPSVHIEIVEREIAAISNAAADLIDGLVGKEEAPITNAVHFNMGHTDRNLFRETLRSKAEELRVK